jgi:hypothetical protein
MARVLRPGGLLLLAFHAGNETLHEDELWGQPISIDFYLFEPSAIRDQLIGAKFTIEEVLLRQHIRPRWNIRVKELISWRASLGEYLIGSHRRFQLEIRN